jgi:hypothetical protein
MANKIIPTDTSLPNYNQVTTLDGEEYQFEFRFNDRDQSWTMNIRDESGTLLHSGVRLVEGALLAQRSASKDFPAGFMFLLSQDSSKSDPPALGELGNEFLLAYEDVSDA